MSRHHLCRGQVRVTRALRGGGRRRRAAAAAASAVMSQLRPSMPRYERMRAALLSFHALETRGGCRRLTPDPALFDADLCFTARAQDDGSVRFHHDVYGRSESMDDQAEERKAPARAARLEETDAAAGGPTATRQSSGCLPATGARPHAPRRTSAGR